MISAVILNWNRPYNLKTLILPVLEQYPCIDEIIISHGKRETVFEYESDRCRIVHRQDYGDLNRDYGLALRFLAALGARNDTVLSLDDDILIPESSLAALLHEFVSDPDVVHSLYGRNPDRKLRYCNIMRFGEVTYAVANAALLPKRLAGLFFDHAPLVNGLAKKKTPAWYGEDLFLSLVAIKVNRRLNRAHPLPHIQLTVHSHEDIPRNLVPGHLEDRSLFSQHAIAALQVRHLVKKSPGYPAWYQLRKSFLRTLMQVTQRGLGRAPGGADMEPAATRRTGQADADRGVPVIPATLLHGQRPCNLKPGTFPGGRSYVLICSRQ